MTVPDLTTPNLGMPYIAAAQAQKHVTHNEAIRGLDALVQLAVLSRDLSSPPSAPAHGDRYIVAAGASGAWANHEGDVAAWQDDAWAFYPPRDGWLAWDMNENVLVARDGAAWSPVGDSENSSGGGGASVSVNPAPLVGVNTVADTSNRLAVKSDATLFTHDDVTPGSGDHRLILNKAGPSDTASLLLQSDFSGRAEIGLAGNDGLSIKTSADGADWNDALTIAPDGRVEMPLSPNAKRVRVRGMIGQSFPNGALTQVTYTDVDYDNGGFFVPSLTDGVTIPAGVALVTAYAGIAMGSGVTASVYSEIRFTVRDMNGTVKTAVACAQQNMAPVKCSGPLPVAEGDRLDVGFYQGSGIARTSQASGFTFLAVEGLA